MTLHELFTTGTTGLAEVTPSSIIRLHHGDRFDLRIAPVRKTLNGVDVPMLAYNGAIPGPTLHPTRARRSRFMSPTMARSTPPCTGHGLRLQNRFDGAPHETQRPIPVGGAFTYRLQLPDAGLYWFDPHIREDFAQEMGLYGTIIVEPTDADAGRPARRGRTHRPFGKSGPTFSATGRFGNVMLINTETEFSALAQHETFVDDVLLAPSERAVLDVLFDTPGTSQLEHRTPQPDV